MQLVCFQIDTSATFRDKPERHDTTANQTPSFDTLTRGGSRVLADPSGAKRPVCGTAPPGWLYVGRCFCGAWGAGCAGISRQPVRGWRRHVMSGLISSGSGGAGSSKSDVGTSASDGSCSVTAAAVAAAVTAAALSSLCCV